jgi:hypothetical protein
VANQVALVRKTRDPGNLPGTHAGGQQAARMFYADVKLISVGCQTDLLFEDPQQVELAQPRNGLKLIERNILGVSLINELASPRDLWTLHGSAA